MKVDQLIMSGSFYEVTTKCYQFWKNHLWLADGTYNITSEMFYQQYSIHVSVSGIACIYNCLPRKKSYHRFLQPLTDLALNRRPRKTVSFWASCSLFIPKNPRSAFLGLFFPSQSYLKKYWAGSHSDLRNKSWFSVCFEYAAFPCIWKKKNRQD